MHCIDEGMAVRNGENLNIQCLMIDIAHPRELDGVCDEPHYHYHKYIELIYILEGVVEANIGSESYSVSQGEFVVIYSGEPHRFCQMSSCRYIVVKMLPDILVTSGQTFNEFEYFLNLTNPDVKKTRIISDDVRIGKLMENAYRTFYENEYCSELIVRADIIKVCACLLEHWRQKGQITCVGSRPAVQNLEMINRVVSYVKDVNGDIRTHEAAKLCNLSDGYFSRVFKSLMGKTFTEYAKSVKIAEAERLLKCTDMSVTDIAQLLGYATSSHFAEDFRKEKGTSPKKYKMR